MRRVPRGFALIDSLLALLALSLGLSPVALWLLQEARLVSEGRLETRALWLASNALEAWPPAQFAHPLASCTARPVPRGKILIVQTRHAAAQRQAAYGQVCVSWNVHSRRRLVFWVPLP